MSHREQDPAGQTPAPAQPAAGDNPRKIKVKIPLLPPVVSYETELDPDSLPGRVWARLPSPVRAAIFLLIILAVVGLAAWRLIPREEPPEPPELYAVRITVLDASGRPVEGSTVHASVGSEPQRVPGGFEVEIPRAKLPEDRRVTFRAEHPATSGQGTAELVLGEDPTPAVAIELSVAEATVRGTVLGPDGRTLAGARVSVPGYGEEAVTTSDSGTFELPAHRPRGERVRLHTEHPDHPPKDQYCFAGSTDCQIRLRAR